MRLLIACADDLLVRMVGGNSTSRDRIEFLVENLNLKRKIQRHGFKGIQGAFSDPALYQAGGIDSVDQLIVHLRTKKAIASVLSAARSLRSDLPILLLLERKSEGKKLEWDVSKDPHLTQLSMDTLFGLEVRPTIMQHRTQAKVAYLKSLFQDGEPVSLLLQHDPDPDSLASALALREILDRKRSTTPIVTLGRITRPENRAMVELLGIDIEEEANPDEIKSRGRIAMLDVQPPYFQELFPSVDLVIDHHPVKSGYTARFKDVRTSYGATATILTEYLRASGSKISQRLATALLYGIKSDTLNLQRATAQADLEAFCRLYPLSNGGLIRRMERPSIDLPDLQSLGRALSRIVVDEGILAIHLGEVTREDVIPQFVEFCMQVEGVIWGAVSGIYDGKVVISVRNVGYVESAGRKVEAFFNDCGSAGGHRSSAKAVVPVDVFERNFGNISEETIRKVIRKMATTDETLTASS
jgi:nanoRNase/pAp phosphatase (c-di-AMP/oligoRNAs hydrolase)